MGSRSLAVTQIDRCVLVLLESARTGAGLSVRALAERAGVARTRANDVLRGDRPMTLGEFVAIVRALGLAPVEVLREVEAQLITEARVSNLIEEEGSEEAARSRPDVVPMRRRGTLGRGLPLVDAPADLGEWDVAAHDPGTNPEAETEAFGAL